MLPWRLESLCCGCCCFMLFHHFFGQRWTAHWKEAMQSSTSRAPPCCSNSANQPPWTRASLARSHSMLGGQDQQVLHKFQRRCKRVYIVYWCLLMFTDVYWCLLADLLVFPIGFGMFLEFKLCRNWSVQRQSQTPFSEMLPLGCKKHGRVCHALQRIWSQKPGNQWVLLSQKCCKVMSACEKAGAKILAGYSWI